MNDRVFLDTNVLVYAFDDADPVKQGKSQALLSTISQGAVAVVSTQVLQEFYVTTVRKLARPLTEETAEQAVTNFAKLPVVQIDTAMVLSAIHCSRRYQLSLWDALIVRAAHSGGCTRLLTEDLQHGQQFGTLTVENPYL